MNNSISKTLLLVEDNMLTADAQMMMLRNNGYNVIHAQNGKTAIDLVKNNNEIKLVLMDIDLGKGINGPDAAERILELKALPIVFLTCYSQGDIVDKVKNIARYGYVIKDSGAFVLYSSIDMAFELFEAHRIIEEKMKTLEEKEKTFAKIFNTNPVLMSVSTIDEGLFTEVNRTFLNVLGYDREEIIGKRSSEINLWADIKDRSAAVALLKKQGYLRHFETKVLTKDGTVHYGLFSVDFIEMNGEKQMLSAMTDITEKKAAQEAVKKSESLYHLLADHMSDAVWLMDLNLNTTYCSPSVIKLGGYSAEEVIRVPVKKQLTKKSYETAMAIFKNEMIKVKEDPDYIFVIPLEMEFIKKDGTLFIGDCTFTLIRGESGEPESILGETRDITGRKESENKINRLLKEKELLLKEVHHRIKNNMQTIASLLYIQADTLNDKTASAALTDAHNRVLSMMLIYEKLYTSKDFCEISAKTYLAELIKNIHATLNITSGIQIIHDIENCTVDSSKLFPLGIIINELLTNTFKYAFPSNRPGTVTCSLKKISSSIEVVISDNGIGLPDSILSLESKGFGINLVKILVEQLRGSIAVNNKNGTEYRITFAV